METNSIINYIYTLIHFIFALYLLLLKYCFLLLSDGMDFLLIWCWDTNNKKRKNHLIMTHPNIG
jgi:nicotinamide riboside transporter PnuC